MGACKHGRCLIKGFIEELLALRCPVIKLCENLSKLVVIVGLTALSETLFIVPRDFGIYLHTKTQRSKITKP